MSVLRARRARHGQRGVSALEFAIIAPTVILVLFTAIETGILMMADATLGRVANDIARQGQMSQLTSSDCAGSIRSKLATGMGGWVFDEGDISVELVKVYNPGDYATPFPEDGSSALRCSAGEPGALMVYKMGFTSPGFSGVLNWLNINVMRFERSVVVQNGP